jgi:hypothetical protein
MLLQLSLLSSGIHGTLQGYFCVLPIMRPAIGASALVWICGAALHAQQPHDARAIMDKVAANVSAATEARRQYVYHEKVRATMVYSNGKPYRREVREYNVVPSDSSTEKVMTSFSGEYNKDGKVISYYSPDDPLRGDQFDAKNLAEFTDELVNARGSRDGIPSRLFPLRTEDLEGYRFSMLGETSVEGRRAFRIGFEPDQQKGICTGEQGTSCHNWKGEVLVDAAEYQPVRITTKMAKGVPLGVRVFMGINVRQLGFSIRYRRVAGNVWFPAGYGTEFGLTVFWGYKRTITLSLENNDFRRTDAETVIQYDSP